MESEKILRPEDVTTQNKALGAPFVPKVTNKRGIEITTRVVNDRDVPFDVVSFEKFKSKCGKALTSDVYKHYRMLAHKNTSTPAGWALCSVMLSGGCSLEKGCQTFDPDHGTTNLLRHQKSHKEEHESQSYHQRKLGRSAKSKIARAACLATVEDLRPFSFAEGAGMRHYVNRIFEAEQATAIGENIDLDDPIPSARTV